MQDIAGACTSQPCSPPSREGVLAKLWRNSEEVVGSAGAVKFRTSWDINLIIGIPFSRWGARPFAIHPLPYPVAHIEQLIHRVTSGSVTTNRREHPIHLARKWQEKLRSDPTLTKAQIAAKEGLSRARVTQVMSLLKLPADILHFIASLTNPKEIRFFSERRLCRILPMEEPSLQLRAWDELVRQFESARPF